MFREKAAGAGYALGAALMGLLWYSGLVVYGMGADALGALGGIVGWPVFMSVDIIAGMLWGFLGGEWKGASRTACYCSSGSPSCSSPSASSASETPREGTRSSYPDRRRPPGKHMQE